MKFTPLLRSRRALLLVLAVGLTTGVVQAQTVTFNVTPATAVSTATPIATWSTSPAATSCTASGGWSGTKAAAGTQTLTAISANASYTISCAFGATGSATVSWTAPTTNTDGSALTNLAGFEVAYGDSPTSFPNVTSVAGASMRTLFIERLAGGTWYFTVVAVNAVGRKSDRSNVLSKVIAAPVSRTATDTVIITAPPTTPPPPPPPTTGNAAIEQVVWDTQTVSGQLQVRRHVGDVPIGYKCANATTTRFPYLTGNFCELARPAVDRYFEKDVAAGVKVYVRCS